MILYYSATGNTEYIAKEIAERLDDTCVDLLDRIKQQNYEPLHSEKPYIICAPVYVCEMPRNYIANDAYPMLETEEIENRIINSHNQIAPAVETIKNGGKLKARHIFLFETIITVPFNPSWGDTCSHCMACIGNCPTRAIEYGKITQEKEQYNFGKYKYVVTNLKGTVSKSDNQ